MLTGACTGDCGGVPPPAGATEAALSGGGAVLQFDTPVDDTVPDPLFGTPGRRNPAGDGPAHSRPSRSVRSFGVPSPEASVTRNREFGKRQARGSSVRPAARGQAASSSRS